jgi:hypothetical protein
VNEAESKSESQRPIWRFYVTFFLALATEGLIVEGIHLLCDWAHVGYLALPVALVGFIVVGQRLAVAEIRDTEVGQNFRDPILWFACRLQRWLQWAGFFVNACLLGTVAAGAALKQTGSPHGQRMAWLAAILFAGLWVPLIMYVPGLA